MVTMCYWIKKQLEHSRIHLRYSLTGKMFKARGYLSKPLGSYLVKVLNSHLHIPKTKMYVIFENQCLPRCHDGVVVTILSQECSLLGRLKSTEQGFVLALTLGSNTTLSRAPVFCRAQILVLGFNIDIIGLGFSSGFLFLLLPRVQALNSACSGLQFWLEVRAICVTLIGFWIKCKEDSLYLLKQCPLCMLLWAQSFHTVTIWL